MTTHTDRETYERELAERQRKHLEAISVNARQRWKPCLHDQCQQCHGTGRTAFGPCVHGLACDCPKCSPFSWGN